MKVLDSPSSRRRNVLDQMLDYVEPILAAFTVFWAERLDFFRLKGFGEDGSAFLGS